ncbi:MAG: FAD binding domain-containing protein [Spirochaetales bacterium]|nr:FAD binding domain-containing protein [Spirochaetales bacterium]
MVKGYPLNLKEALEMRAEGFRPIGGGTDLMVRYRNLPGLPLRLEEPLLYLRGLEELSQLEQRENQLCIGASVTLKALLESALTPEPFKEVIRKMASFGIRSEATLAGNLGNASPAADSLPFLYCREASLVLISLRGKRSVPLSDFIVGPGRTVLEGDEIISEILLPQRRVSLFYHKKVGGRRSDAISKLSFYGEATKKGETIVDLRLAFGAVAPCVIRLREGEEALLRALAGQGDEREAAGLYEKALKPIDDQRSTAEYRRRVSWNLLQHFTELLR